MVTTVRPQTLWTTPVDDARGPVDNRPAGCHELFRRHACRCTHIPGRVLDFAGPALPAPPGPAAVPRAGHRTQGRLPYAACPDVPPATTTTPVATPRSSRPRRPCGRRYGRRSPRPRPPDSP